MHDFHLIVLFRLPKSWTAEKSKAALNEFASAWTTTRVRRLAISPGWVVLRPTLASGKLGSLVRASLSYTPSRALRFKFLTGVLGE